MTRPGKQSTTRLLNDVLRVVPIADETDRIRQRTGNGFGEPAARRFITRSCVALIAQERLPSKGPTRSRPGCDRKSGGPEPILGRVRLNAITGGTAESARAV
jgi:hypothetical protein